jgi:hypothetical protein
VTAAKRGRAALAALPLPAEQSVPEAPAVPARNTAFTDPEAQPIPVDFGECPCPGTPHPGGDTLFLRPELDLQGGFTFTSAFADNTQDTAGMPLEQALGTAYLVAGIAAWTFLDADGQPIPASRANIAKLRWTPAVGEVADIAARRYGAAALLPLVAGAQRRSAFSLTDHLTSQKKASSGRRPKR